jgi:hypothetical protein
VLWVRAHARAHAPRAWLFSRGHAAHGSALHPGPKRPVSLAKILVSRRQWHMAHQQSRHHVFGNRVLVPKAIGQRAVRGQQGGGDGVGARCRRVEQTCLQGLGHGAVELNADHHVRVFIQRPVARLVQAIAQVTDAVLGPDKVSKPWRKLAAFWPWKTMFNGAVFMASQSGKRYGARRVHDPACKGPAAGRLGFSLCHGPWVGLLAQRQSGLHFDESAPP